VREKKEEIAAKKKEGSERQGLRRSLVKDSRTNTNEKN
jgi:hypothetical protein